MVHAELPAVLERAASVGGDPRSYRTWLATRPAEAETAGVELLIEVARDSGLRVHVVHVSAPETVDRIEAARKAGVRITAETCPHYLGFAAEEIPDGATEFKCAPPIRDRRSRDGLWDALAKGRLDAVVSDHSPAPPSLKLPDEGDFLRAWGGVASLQLRLPAVWTGAATRGLSLEQLAELLCTGPARLVGLDGRKGAIARGYDADLVLWNPEEEFVVEETKLMQRHSLTPWVGHRLKGTVRATYLRGEPVLTRPGRLLSRLDS
jgi:allantoinase